MKFLTLALVLFSANATACYPTITGVVTYVSDGDTIVVTPVGKPAFNVRLADIDAPEISHFGSLAQPYGDVSKAELTALLLNQTVKIDPHSIDSYGRKVSTVLLGTVNVNRYMVSKGLAWAYIRYALDTKVISLQKTAKTAGLGLWADANPIEPSVWRSTH